MISDMIYVWCRIYCIDVCLKSGTDIAYIIWRSLCHFKHHYMSLYTDISQNIIDDGMTCQYVNRKARFCYSTSHTNTHTHYQVWVLPLRLSCPFENKRGQILANEYRYQPPICLQCTQPPKTNCLANCFSNQLTLNNSLPRIIWH